MNHLVAVRSAVRAPIEADQIKRMLPHRSPFLLLDRVVALDPPASATGLKNVTIAEPWFAGHFPERAILPGVLLTESLAQLAAVLIAAEGLAAEGLAAKGPAAEGPAETEEAAGPRGGRIGLLAEVKQFRYRRAIVPGDQVRLEVQLTRQVGPVREFSCQATVAGTRAAHGSIVVTS